MASSIVKPPCSMATVPIADFRGSYVPMKCTRSLHTHTCTLRKVSAFHHVVPISQLVNRIHIQSVVGRDEIHPSPHEYWCTSYIWLFTQAGVKECLTLFIHSGVQLFIQ